MEPVLPPPEFIFLLSFERPFLREEIVIDCAVRGISAPANAR
jgi:hypothetical protein